MDERYKRILGDGPYPFRIDELNGTCGVESFLGQGMIVLATKDKINMPRGSHMHDSYEFLLPASDMPTTSVDKKATCFQKNRLFPINSEQPHGPVAEIMGCDLLAFQIQKETLKDIVKSYCNQSDVAFENESIKIDREIPELLRMFMEETRNFQTGSEFIQQNLINLIVIHLLRQVKSNIPLLVTEKKYCERDNINRAICYLREEFNNEFSLEDVARTANLSQYHFIRIFKSVTGKTPYDYLLEVKIEKAIELLKLKKYTITEICFMCGFNNLAHFSSVFKRKVGILPSQYKRI